MTLILIIGVLIPIIYIMRLNIKQKTIRLKETLNTVLLSIVGITIFLLLEYSSTIRILNYIFYSLVI